MTARRALFVFVLSEVVELGVSILFVFYVGSQRGFTPSVADPWEVALRRIVPKLAGAGCAVWLLTRGAGARSVLADLGWRAAPAGWIALGTAIGALVAISGSILTLAFPPTNDIVLGVAWASRAQRHVWAVSTGLLAPSIEEFLFRGVLLTGFSRSWGTTIAVTLVTALFTAVHVGGEPWTALVSIACGGLAFALLRLWSRSLLPAVAAHGAYNLVFVLLAYF